VRSLYDDILATLGSHDFTIPNVSIRKPYDETPKAFPLIVVHEITNVPKSYGSVNGEERTVLAYQLDIHTRACTDEDDVVLSMWDAGRRLFSEVTDLLETEYKITRRSVAPTAPIKPDELLTIWRGECVADSYGYSYRR